MPSPCAFCTAGESAGKCLRMLLGWAAHPGDREAVQAVNSCTHTPDGNNRDRDLKSAMLTAEMLPNGWHAL